MKKKTIFGILLLLISALFLLNRLDSIKNTIDTYWPFILIFFGIATMLAFIIKQIYRYLIHICILNKTIELDQFL